MNKYAWWASRDIYSEIVGNRGDILLPRGNEGELYKLNKGDAYPRGEGGEGSSPSNCLALVTEHCSKPPEAAS